MVRRIKSAAAVKRRYFGELLTDKEIRKHAVKNNFKTDILEEIYQKELAGHIVNFFMKWSSVLDISEKMIENLRIVEKDEKNYWAKYDPASKLWKFRLSMGILPIDIIDYLVLEVLCHYHMISNNVDFEEVMLEKMPDYKERSEKLKEIEDSEGKVFS